MATELQQARFEAGGDASMCELCRPSIEGRRPHVGFQEGKVVELPDPGIQLTKKLSDIVTAAKQCWVCGWLLLLFRTRLPELLTQIPASDYERVNMSLSPRSIQTSRPLNNYTTPDPKKLNQIYVLVDPRNIFKKIEYILYLQESRQQPIQVPYLLDTSQSLEWPDHRPYEARIRPPVADLRICKRWKDACTEFHGGVCDIVKVPGFPTIRLIDVVLRCVVHLPATVPWVALSYCWGGPQVHSLRKSNLTEYGMPGALNKERVPPVIFDAIVVTEALGERYLWVDSLCIIQDDDLDKPKYLSIMDAIYAHAVLTIINGASGDTLSGLPGIGKTLQRRTQEPFELNGVWVTETLDPMHDDLAGYLGTCTWSTRGWTFQEGVLSRRCLIFTADQIYWQCQTSSWCEGSFWECSEDIQIYRHFHGSNGIRNLAAPNVQQWASLYINILQSYVEREFTSEGDVMHALSGVLRLLKQLTGLDHFWGLPISVLEPALTWIASGPPILREARHRYVDSEGQLRSCPFPSWSWIGWRAKGLQAGVLHPSDVVGILRLHFYRIDDKGEPKPLVEAGPPPASDADADDSRKLVRYPSSAHHPWLDHTRQTITKADIPPILHASFLAPSLLCFWTSVAVLRIVRRGWDGYWNEPFIVLCDPAGEVELGGRWSYGDFFERQPETPPGKDMELNLPASGKFIVVGATRQRMRHGGELTLTLLMVETLRGDGEAEAATSGVCRRRYLVKEVLERRWEKLLQQTRRWELVFLA